MGYENTPHILLLFLTKEFYMAKCPRHKYELVNGGGSLNVCPECGWSENPNSSVNGLLTTIHTTATSQGLVTLNAGKPVVKPAGAVAKKGKGKR